MKKVFVLYQTDVWKSYSSRVCFGVYSSEEKAIKASKKLIHADAEIDIVEHRLDKFEEL